MTGASATPGGIATCNLNIIYSLIDLLNSKNCRLKIFSLLEKNNDRPQFLPENIQFKSFNGNRLLYILNVLHTLLMNLNKRNIFLFDHVNLSIPIAPFSYLGLTKQIVFAHGSESWKRLKTISKFSFKYSSLVLTNSEYTLRNMRLNIEDFNGKSCPLGLSPNFELNSSIPEDEINDIKLISSDGNLRILDDRVLLLVARMHSKEREKGHYQLMNILPDIKKEFPDIQLVFPGIGDDIDYLKKVARDLGISSSVFFPGYVNIETLKELYQKCFAYVMPSTQEGFGLVYLEAMNFGKPCIGCFNQGAEDIMVHEETGYLVHDPNDFEELKKTILSLLQNPQSAKRMGVNGFNRLHAYFTSISYQERLKNHLSEILC